jgi:hypothetical protein
MTARPRTWAAMRVIEHDLRQDRADEFMKVGHWDTWEDDAVVQDKTTGLFAIQEKVHRVDHQGGYFRSFSGGAAALKQQLSLPNSRFARIDGAARQGLDAQQCLRTARFGACQARPFLAKRE